MCLNDCPKDYPYYKKTQDENSNDIYPCSSICNGFYIPNEGTSRNATLCIDSCPPGSDYPDYSDYKYKYVYMKDEREVKECRKTCPPEAKYYIEISGIPSATDDNECHTECPSQAPYHKIGEDKCLKLSEFRNGFLLYDKKEWTNYITECPNEYALYTKIDSNGVTIWLNECNFVYHDDQNNNDILYGYKTPYKTCVADCTSTTNSLTSGKNLIHDEINQECICENLYYLSDRTFEKNCYHNTITKCENKGDGHILLLNGTIQCL